MSGRAAAIVAIFVTWAGFVIALTLLWGVGVRVVRGPHDWQAPTPRPLSLQLLITAQQTLALLITPLLLSLAIMDEGSLIEYLRWFALFIIPTLFVFAVGWTRGEVAQPKKIKGEATFHEINAREKTRGSLVFGLLLLAAIVLGVRLAGWMPWNQLEMYRASQYVVGYPEGWSVSEAGIDDPIRPPNDSSHPAVTSFPEVSFSQYPDSAPIFDVRVFETAGEAQTNSSLFFQIAAGEEPNGEEVAIEGAKKAEKFEVEQLNPLMFGQENRYVWVDAFSPDGGAVTLTMYAPVSDFENYEDTFDRIVDSFELIPD